MKTVWLSKKINDSWTDNEWNTTLITRMDRLVEIQNLGEKDIHIKVPIKLISLFKTVNKEKYLIEYTNSETNIIEFPDNNKLEILLN